MNICEKLKDKYDCLGEVLNYGKSKTCKIHAIRARSMGFASAHSGTKYYLLESWIIFLIACEIYICPAQQLIGSITT
jgi:hypothetical protein